MVARSGLPKRPSRSVGGATISAARWTSKLLLLGEPTPVLTLADDLANSGEYLWTVPSSVSPSSDYLIQITRNDVGLTDTSNSTFAVTEPIHIYYVNDETVEPGDWTTASGNDTNDGLSPTTPKASVSALLATYSLGSGDVIKVDSGAYSLATNIVVTQDDSGVVIEGYHDDAYPGRMAVLDRGSTSVGSYVIELAGADEVTLEHLQLTGGREGIYAAIDAGSNGLTVSPLRHS